MKTAQTDKPAAKTPQTDKVRMGRDVSNKKAAGGNSASEAKAAQKKEKAERQEDKASALV